MAVVAHVSAHLLLLVREMMICTLLAPAEQLGATYKCFASGKTSTTVITDIGRIC